MSLYALLRTYRICVTSSSRYRKNPEIIFTSNTRFFQTTQVQHITDKPFKELKEKEKRVKFYFLSKYVDHLYTVINVLQKSFPTALHMYRVFTLGVQDFFQDCKNYLKINRILSKHSNDFRYLTRKEIEIYDQLPKDMIKLAPIMIMSALPFTMYFILPIVYVFPRQLLTHHFWTIQQRHEFSTCYLKKRLVNNRPVFRYLQEQLDNLEDFSEHSMWANVLGLLGSGHRPSVGHILLCRSLFEKEPYHLVYLRPRHVRHLLGLHGLHRGFYRRRRLRERAQILLEMDKAINREGGVHNLPLDDLRKVCYIRGFNTGNAKHEDMIDWLKNWLYLSEHVNEESLSLILHAPVLLGYNEPSNWRMIYSKN